MADDEGQRLLTALVTEHFAQQGTATATISESGSRAALYMVSLSSSLVALGFAASSPTAFAPLAGAVIPILFLLGWFTVGRLVDTSIQSVVALERVSQIRAYYTTLTPDAQRRRDWRAECVRRSIALRCRHRGTRERLRSRSRARRSGTGGHRP
jgi:hypothetical protein